MSNTHNQPSGMMTQGLIAHLVRWVFLCRIPGLSTAIIWVYAKIMKADFYDHQLKDFDCLLAFFLRSRDLSIKMRGQDLVGGYVSPVEGTITFWGKLSHNDTIPIKGAGFSVARLVGFDAPHLQTAVVFYLSPGNYHHVHAPVDMVVEDYFELPGKLETVSPRLIPKKPMLYAENYRQVVVAKTTSGERLVLVLVGAKNVGNISCPKLAGFSKESPIHYKKGEELGFFSLGSTVVLLVDRSIAAKKKVGEQIDVIDALFEEGAEHG